MRNLIRFISGMAGATMLAVVPVALPTTAEAQEGAPLVRERPSVSVSTSRSRTDRDQELMRPTETPAPTPDPHLTVVAIVNNHRITRAELNCRLEAVTGANVDSLFSNRGNTQQQTRALVSSLLGDGTNVNVLTQDIMLQEEQDEGIRSAIRREEERMVYEWVDQMMLADEARRQGFVISTQEFEERKRSYEQEFGLRNRDVDEFLAAMCMDRAQLDSFIYDALLVERLIDRFVQLNFTEDQLRHAYNEQPYAFQTPPQWRIARFTVSVSDRDSENVRRGLQRKAEQVRNQLRNSDDPTALFEELNDFELGVIGSELTWATTSGQIDRATRTQLESLRPGQTSNVYTTYVAGSDGRARPEAFHVVKLMEVIPGTGETYESARPRIMELMGERSRFQILAKLREARTHRAIINMSGISGDRMPSAAELRQQRPPVDLRLASR